ncbi:MAG: F0F1 ATP synthase subunit gamma [Candidatus Omnitrophica bacterium]|nr:F0F1 ATP synthase subunit gamma [Candidatus Omnitrophota bacterium]
MKTLSNIKKDLEFNNGLSNLIEVLKNIAVSQFHALEGRMKNYDILLNTINGFFELVDPHQDNHPFLIPGNKMQIVVAVTSDSGLLGGLNMQVVNAALHELEQMPGRLVVVGERGKTYARETKIAFVSFGGIKEEEQYYQVKQLRDYLVSSFLKESAGYLKVVFPRPISFTVQKAEVVNFLPFRPESKEGSSSQASLPDVILDSRPEDIIGYLAYLWMGQKLSQIFVLSRLAEFAARFVHLEGSSQRLKEMDKTLRLQYFRIRHELIDRNMRELFSARLLYAG